MSEPLDTVTVRLGTTEVTLPFDARQELLVQLGAGEIAAEIGSAFAAAGSTGPVELTHAQKAYMLAAIEKRADEDLPEAVPALREALIADLQAARGPSGT
jgi:hypothetical protein